MNVYKIAQKSHDLLILFQTIKWRPPIIGLHCQRCPDPQADVPLVSLYNISVSKQIPGMLKTYPCMTTKDNVCIPIFVYLKYHIHLYIFLRKSLPGLSLQRPTAPNVVASLKQGDLDEFDAGTRPKSQSSRSSASPRPLTSRASTTKLKVTFFCQIFTPLIMKILHKRIIIIWISNFVLGSYKWY